MSDQAGTIFEKEVDLSSGDWVEWDEKMLEPVELFKCRLIVMEAHAKLDPIPYECTLCDRRFSWHNEAPSHYVPWMYLCHTKWCGRTVSTDQVHEHKHVPLGTK